MSHNSELLQNVVKRMRDAGDWYVNTRNTTKIGNALMFSAIITAGLGLVTKDAFTSLFCCNSLGLASLVLYSISFYSRRK